MELAVGAMAPLFPKLLQLLQDKYVEQKGLKREVESLSIEMQMVYAALVEVSRVSQERLSEPDKLWARQIRELSYDMEDAIDAFMVRVARREATPDDANIFQKIANKAKSSIKKIKERHHISDKIKDIKNLSKEICELHTKYKFSSGAPPLENIGIDPRVINLYKKEEELVGIEEARKDLIQMLMHPPEDKSPKRVSIVGCGGLGKTTLAKVVHHQLNKVEYFECSAFVSVGRNPNITNTLREMLEKLLDSKCSSDTTNWTRERFCEELRKFLRNKRYNIVVDDVWETKTWEAINYALPDCDSGSKVIVTTRNSAVISTKDCNVYKLKPLSAEKSKELFNRRTSGRSGENELVDKIIDKCDGVPLSIIAIASLLDNRPLEDWQTVYNSLIVGREEDRTRTILLYSYHDLPYYLKPCLLYLSMYPEDCSINKYSLIWRWIAEGFVQPDKESGNLFEVGERHFNELMNRSMIEPEEYKLRTGVIHSCRVHDIVLDLIRDLSTEENFVTVLSEKKLERDTSIKEEVGLHGLERKKVRRLSIQWSKKTKFIPQDAIGMPEVLRSLDTQYSFIDNPLLSSLQACRVLAVEGMDYCSGDLKHLGKLLNLRYLEIKNYGDVLEIPKEIGKLKSLQTLILPYNLKELPAAVCELTQLVCLNVFGPEVLPVERMGNLMRLEELRLWVKGEAQGDMLVVELGKLTRLRVLMIRFRIWFRDVRAAETFYMTLIQSLNNLQELKELILFSDGGIPPPVLSDDPVLVSAWKSWEPPRQLWFLDSSMALFSSQSQLISRCLRLRYLCLVEVEGVDMGILALLPELVYLKLKDPPCYRHNDGCIIVGAEGFKNLRVCKIPRVLKFLPGAMPSLESLCFMVRPAPAEESSNLEWGLGNLVSLKEVKFGIDCLGCLEAEVMETRAKLTHTEVSHPRCPTIQIKEANDDFKLDEDSIKPDKVLTDTVHVRDVEIKRYDDVDVGCLWNVWDAMDVEYWLCHYRCLEEINCNIDCEGSRLSKVERMEAWIRQAAARHPRRPKLLAMNRINQDKIVMDDRS